MESFFSQTLTVLYLTECENVPLTIFSVLPNLREVSLERVEVFESGDDEYPDTGRELPALKCLIHRHSASLLKQMISPLSVPVIDWSRLRVLKLFPWDKEGMACLQPILDATCNTLEELYLIYDTVPALWYGKPNGRASKHLISDSKRVMLCTALRHNRNDPRDCCLS